MRDELIDYVRAAAFGLKADLREAEQRTNGWRDAHVAYPLLESALDLCVAQLTATGCEGAANRLPSSEFWNIVRDYLTAGELQLRARMKPRGYAGDFELLAKICEQYHSDDPLGGLFDYFFQSQAAPQAVRNRTLIVADEIVRTVRNSTQSQCKIVSFGCSAAVDVEMAVRALSAEDRQRMNVVLLDLDPAAIEHCQSRLSQYLQPPQLTCLRENLLRLPKLPQLQESISATDFLFCTGLFDYLEPAPATAMLETFWRNLTPNGKMLVFNFGHENPSRGYMEWIGNWYLLYRSRDDLSQLATDAGLPRDLVKVDSEPTGVNLYLSVRRGDAN